MISEHMAAVTALIPTASPTTTTLYVNAAVPDNAPLPYVVLYGDQGMPENNSAADESSFVYWTFQSTYVAANPEQARLLADRINTALVDKRPVVSGYSCGLISKTSSQKVRPDNDVKPPVYFAVDQWSYSSVPA